MKTTVFDIRGCGFVLRILTLGLLIQSAKPQNQSVTSAPDAAALKAEIERLKAVVPDQAHAMADVGYHFANLWFAGQKKNWPLADFYWSETRSHLNWAVRIIPVRKDPKGNDIRLADILAPIEATSLKELHDSIIAGNANQFERAYKQTLESCYACHVAAGKAFLRLRIPDQPAATIINFDPGD
jgi:hypothetical protein